MSVRPLPRRRFTMLIAMSTVAAAAAALSPASAFAGSAILSPEELRDLEALLNAEEPKK